MRDLREQLNRSLKMQEELSREVGRMRTLVECRSEAKKAVSAELAERVENGTRGNPPASAGARSQASGRACFNCGDLSHFARNCPLRRSNERDAPGANDSAVATRTPETSDDRRVRILDVERLDRAAYLRMTVQGESVSCLLDTGSEVCLFPGRYAKVGDPKSNRQRLFAANGTEISVLGEVELEMSVGPIQFTVRGLCSNNVAEIILGLNFLREQEVVWDFAVGDVFLRGQRFELHARSGVNACRRVILESEVSIPPRSEVMAVANVEFSGRFDANQTWATRSRQVTEHVHAASSVLPNRAVDVPIRILNAGHETVTLGVGTEITTADPVIIEQVPVPSADEQHASGNVETAVRSMVAQVDENVPIEVREQLMRLMLENASAFSFDELDVGRATAVQHEIDVGDARPVRQRLRRQPPAHQVAIDSYVQDMLRQGVIEPTQSPWAANLVVVRKKSGDFRVCCDYRGLNLTTRKDAYSLPRIDACLDSLSGAVWFSTFDLRNSYYQVEVAEKDRDKTAFICRGGQYRYCRMPMGLCNSGATFQRLVDVILSGLSYDICLAYIDDLLVFSRSLPEHLDRLKIVLGRLKAAGLKIKPSKTSLLRRSVAFLGHLVSADGISPHPEKTEQILNWDVPRCVRDVRAFIGITSYYRKYIKDYGRIASPLTALTAKNKVFVWSQECQEAFEMLKAALVSPPILAMPLDDAQYLLDTDSSNFAIGAVLSQLQDGQERVIAYASRHLSTREQNYCVTRRELLAVVYYLKYFRHYLLGAKLPVRIRTDHAAILWLRRIPEPVGQQARWLETMEEFNFTVEHRAGRLHCNADAMSRIPCNNRRCCPPQDRDANGRTDGANGWVEGGDMRVDASGDQLIACSIRVRDVECPRTSANYRREVDRRADADIVSLDRPDEVTDRARRYTMRADTGGTPIMNGDGATDDTLCKQPFDGWPDADVKRAETSLKIPEDRRWAEGSEKSAETLLEGSRAVRTADGNNDTKLTRATVTDDGSTETRASLPVTLTGRGDGDSNCNDGHGARSRPDEAGVRWQDERALAEMQRADPDLTEIIQLLEKGGEQPTWDDVAPLSEAAKILWRQWSRLQIRDGILVRRFEEASGRRGHWQAILPKVLRAEFIAAVHAGVAGGHFGRHRTELAVQARAYWPGWAGDVRRALKTCNACSRYLRGKPPRQVNLKPIVCGEPWELLSIDITGPHPTSRQGHNYILTLQDHFSKWAEAVPIRRHTAPIIARIIFEQVFMRFGAPRRILTDQGPEFESKLFSDLCNLMGVEKVRTTPYHPQTNGMIERMHRVLNAMLAKVISEDQRDWPEHLPAVMAAYRASTHEATGFSPNRLILGREVRLPVDTIYGLPFDRVNVSQSYDDIVCERAERTIFDFHAVRDCLKRAAQLRQDKYDIKVKPVAVEVGQKVWYYCPRRKMNVSPKWQNCYSGPYTVVRIIDPHVIVIARSRRSKPFTVHRDKLKFVAEDDNFDISGGQNLARSTENQTTVPLIDAEDAGSAPERVSRPRRLRKAPSRYDGFVRVAVIPVSDSGNALSDIEMASTGGARGDNSRLWCASCHSSYRDARDLARHFRTAAHYAMEAGAQTPNRSRSGIATRQVSSLRRQQNCDAQTPGPGQECFVRLVRMNDAMRHTEVGDGERPENRPSGAGVAETDAVAELTDTVIDGSSAESESRAAATGVKSATTAIDPVWTAAMSWLHATASAAEGFGLHFSTDAEASVTADVFKEISSFVRLAYERVASVVAERSDGRARRPINPTCDTPMAVEATLSNVRSSASAENIPMRVSTPADSENADPLLSASAMPGSSSCGTSMRASPRVDIDSSYDEAGGAYANLFSDISPAANNADSSIAEG
jgi:transposase InsO family protein